MVANYVKQKNPGAAQSGTGSALLNIMRYSTYYGLCEAQHNP